MTEANSHNLLFWGLCLSSKFYRCMSFLKPALFLPSGKKPLTWWAPYTQSQGTIDTVNLIRYAPENTTSPKAVTGKWLLQN